MSKLDKFHHINETTHALKLLLANKQLTKGIGSGRVLLVRFERPFYKLCSL